MPKVSIVIPTRNRAHLLKHAIVSALRQTYEDTEIIVSDNHSDDETKQVFDSFESPKLRYVRTEAALSMPDSWEFALGHARGKYITYLADDSYLFSNAVAMAVASLECSGVEVVVWKVGAYFAPDWVEPHRRNLLYLPRLSSSTRVVAAERGLRDLYATLRPLLVPRFLNSLCDRRLVEKAIKIQKRLFIPPCPDWSAAVGVLKNVEEYLVLDWPLIVDGVTPASIGARSRFNGGKVTEEFVREFGGSLRFRFGLNIPLTTIYVAESLEAMKDFYPETLEYEISRETLIRQIVDEIVSLESNGADVAGMWEALNEYLSKHPQDIRKVAAEQKRRSRRKMLLKRLRHLPFWEHLERLRGNHVFHGDRWGFGNIEQCGQAAEKLVGQFANRQGAVFAP
jgi:hypothetical protein